MEKEPIIEVRNLKQHFRISDSYTVRAVDGVSFGIARGEVFGLVGETGCGKSTVARALAGIYKPTEGQVLYETVPVSGKQAFREQRKKMQREIQTVFQDSAAALNPRMTVGQIIMEPLRIYHMCSEKADTQQKVVEMLSYVGLDATYLKKYPGELSGGQRQRTAIARSLISDPKMIIADEPIASMDISIQAQIVTLFQRLQQEHGFSMLFIAHDLSMVRFISDRIGVMLKGRLVEIAPTEELFENPLHPYTRSLISAMHVPDPVYERNRKVVDYDRSLELGSEMVERREGHFVLQK
ncbi:MAG: ATP-binding cassette domain-containing protein [Clostridiales bacterium]|nr:ATP-binding cassette domain-containing protein [Clostridiales bacterium]